MIIFALIFFFSVWVFLLVWAISLFIEKEIIPGVFVLILGILPAGLCSFVMHAQVTGNEKVVEYYFPADHYKFEQIVNVTNEKTVVGSDTLVTTKCDTTYRITGIEPIVGHETNFSTKRYTKEEYDNR